MVAAPGPILGPALGAARLGERRRQGDMSLSDAAQKPPVEDWFDPAPTKETCKSALPAYRTLYPALREVQARLA